MSNSNGTVTSCVNTGNISGSNSVGGIVGQFYGKGTVDQCYNRGAIKAAVSKAGGIVGYLYVSSSWKVKAAPTTTPRPKPPTN